MKWVLGIAACVCAAVAWYTKRAIEREHAAVVTYYQGKIDATIKTFTDSLVMERERATDSINAINTKKQRTVDQHIERGMTSRQRADSLAQDRALQPEPESATDTLWRVRYADAMEENVALRHALAEQDSAVVLQKDIAERFQVDRDQWRILSDKATASMEQIRTDCRTALEASQPSRLGKLLTAGKWVGLGLGAGLLLAR